MAGSTFDRMIAAYQVINNIRQQKEELELRRRQVGSQEESNREASHALGRGAAGTG
jgi:hypothetical protein